jgi:pyruvate dehydrogenase E2 component (dihydrolipoamide acetyltransferase)
MPALGADMEAGTLVEWLKQPGDRLTRGDIIAVVDTAKGAIEIEVFEDGVFERALAAPGQKVPVGDVLATIRTAADEAPSAQAGPDAPAGPAPAGSAPAVTPAAAGPVRPLSAAPRASPGARRAAEELQVDLASVNGTGPAGAVTRDDVVRAASRRGATAPAAAMPVGTPSDRAASMRSAVGAAMSRSKREIPHVYLATTIDMTNALTWLAAANQARAVDRRLLPAALLLKAAARAVRDVPELNGFWIDGAFKPGGGVHVGCAIALRDGGLVAPAIHDADRKDVDTIMRDLLDLTARARGGTLRSSELADPTVTVTNLGDLGVEQAFAVIHPPQVAIMAFGRVMARPWVVDGRVEPRTLVAATISADHRSVDGRRAGQGLAAVDRYLQTPERL